MGSCFRHLAAFKQYLLLHAQDWCLFTSAKCSQQQMYLVHIPDLSSVMLLYVSADTVNLGQRTESGASEAAVACVCGCAHGKCLFKRSGVDVPLHTKCFDVELLVSSYIPDSEVKMELCQVRTHSAGLSPELQSVWSQMCGICHLSFKPNVFHSNTHTVVQLATFCLSAGNF